MLKYRKVLPEDNWIFISQDAKPIYSKLANSIINRSIKRTRLKMLLFID